MAFRLQVQAYPVRVRDAGLAVATVHPHNQIIPRLWLRSVITPFKVIAKSFEA